MDPETENKIKIAKLAFYRTVKCFLGIFPYGNAFSDEDRKFISGIINQLKINDNQWLLLEELRQRDINQDKHPVNFPINYENMVSAAVLTAKIGYDLKLDEKTIVRNTKGSLFHDIGKLDQLEEILYKQDRLTHEEEIEIQKHSQQGYNLLVKSGEEDYVVLSCPLEHQMYIILPPVGAKFKSYPPKISPEQPSQTSRITTLADVTDCIVVGRPYRNPKQFREGSPEKAREEVKRCSDKNNPEGMQLDPDLVAKFIPFLDKVVQNK